MNALSEPERALWAAFPHGGLVDLQGTGQEVRAEFVSELLLGGRTPAAGRVPAVRVLGARVTGPLDVSYAQLNAPVLMRGCEFDEAPVFLEASTKAIDLSGSRLPGLDARGVRTDGGLVLSDCRFAGPLILRGARIGGSLYLDETEIGSSGEDPVNASNIAVDGDLAARGLSVEGRIRFYNARVSGRVILNGARLVHPGSVALGLGGAVVEGGVFCSRGFHVEGEMRLPGARLSGNLTIQDATLANPGGLTLNLERATIANVEAHLVSEGEIRLVGLQVQGRVDLNGTRAGGGATGRAINGDGMVVGDALMLNHVRAEGEVRLRTARVGGRVLMFGGRFENPGGIAVRASRIEVGSDWFADQAVFHGELRISGARIGRLTMSGARLVNPAGPALRAPSLTAEEIEFQPAERPEGEVNLRHAKLSVLRDRPETWPETLEAGGLVYETLEPVLPARDRLRWLARGPFAAQPYEQLAATYTRIGHHLDARRVLYAKERRQRSTLGPLGRAWNVLQEVTVGYGFQPWRAALWLVVLLSVGTGVYAANEPQALKENEAPHFNPLIYTLDLLLPIVDLGQERAFNPEGAFQWFAFGLVAAGWLLATTIAAGVARTLSRR
ncbi:hypothetical protein [Bailinhaonella thermotolerans]|uniref:Membrane-associated oxidoreductase n=1 Tax=Bailinhaonella thermotolerans TaxID=1070861 RepID=A0A3A4AWI3_9ACTN|nr:hypothetical protein [Bailinhaonella thermotolerans]RJL31724.1 hypothetical protein D5H75_18660 [Bailinhaonella thermotolerans]